MFSNDENLEEKIFERYEAVKDNKDIVAASVVESNFMLHTLRENLGDSKQGHLTLLDVGSGKGRFSTWMKQWGFQVTGAEPVAGLVHEAQRLYPDVTFVQASATKLPFPDGAFDIVVCVSVLEQIPDTEAAVREMVRVIRPGGMLLILDKNILGLHPRYLIPVAFWKRFLGESNQWLLFPKQFAFQEKYFVPWKLNDLLKKYCMSSSYEYLYYKPETKPRPFLKAALIAARGVVTKAIHLFAPGLDFYVAWKAIK